MKISYSPEAVADLVRLREFIEVNNPDAARRVATALKRGIGQLKTFPHMGVEVPQAPSPKMVRDLIIGKYTVRYLLRSSDIYILRVWHHRENRL